MSKKLLMLISLMLFIAATGNAQLSEAINFFNYNYCGTGQTVSWRGNCHTGDNPTGGYHDAGDHVKFGLPMAFSVAMLCWADYEYGISATAQIQRGTDYFRRCISGSSIIYQVGDGGADHGYWGSPENQTGSRPSYSTSQGSCVMAGTAAALAAAAVTGNGGDLNLARSAFTAAENAKSDSGYTAANGFYTSNSGFYDELMWAAVWLYLGTNDKAYLTKAETYFNNLNADYQWTHCWDDARYGAILKLAQITGNPKYKEWIEKNLDWWTTKTNGIQYTPGGLPYLQNWGPLRYASAAGFMAKLWSQSQYCTSSKKSTYSTFASNVAAYIRGSNPAGRSYVIGYGSNYPRCPHHRAACPSKTCPCEHTITGALVGGPDSGDAYQDSIDQYQYSEVATDYNACYVALLASLSGGNPPTYPTPTPTPTPGPTASPGTGTGLKGEYYTGTSFGTLVLTRTDGPVDFNWGGSAPDSSLSNDSFSVRWTGELEPVYTDMYTIYESSDDGCRISINNTTVIDQWNDGAAEEFSGTISLRAGQKVPIRIEFYENGGDASIQVSWSSNYQTKQIIPKVRLYSAALVTPTPTPSSTPTRTTTGTPTRTTTVRNGDVNSDGNITIIDALMIAQYYVGLNPSGFNAAAADVNCDGTVTIVDALVIAQYYVGLGVTIC